MRRMYTVLIPLGEWVRHIGDIEDIYSLTELLGQDFIGGGTEAIEGSTFKVLRPITKEALDILSDYLDSRNVKYEVKDVPS